jgi:hypothetical protein
MPHRTAAAALCGLALFSVPAAAEGARHADAHVHGVSHLQIAVEGARVEIELRAPGADIVGFEHAAASDADKAAQEKALVRLRAPAALFGLAGCTAVEVKAHVGAEGGEHDEDGHDDHDAEHDEDEHHDDDAHHDEHEADEHAEDADHEQDAHEDEHGDEDEAASHSEFHGVYALDCDAPVTAVSLAAFFDAFPNAAEVEVEAITDSGARAAEATRAAPLIGLD